MEITRRELVKIGLAGIVATGVEWPSASAEARMSVGRPAIEKRSFRSPAVESVINQVKEELGDSKLARLFENCFPNTLDTTVRTGLVDGKPDTFVITGDIPAMWLRDSSAQVWPYLPLAKGDEKLRALLRGVVHRQARSINLDSYANAFNYAKEGGEWQRDLTKMRPELHERKWEIDSLCYPVRLAFGYWRTTGDADVFDEAWHEAAKTIVRTFREQQRKLGPGPYSFRRNTLTPNDTLGLEGFGNPIRPVGLIASGFRPSDDACIYPFLIPSNLFAVRSLEQLHEIATGVYHDDALASECKALAGEVRDAVKKYAMVEHLEFGKVYAYEVDGFGNRLFMDDANVPSLLSLPYLGASEADDPVYQNTRRFVLSDSNPYFFRGRAAEGIGGPHIGVDMVWPLAIIMRGITSHDEAEITQCLKTLVATDAGTGFMHESFHKDDPRRFTRAWFAWANTLFGEFVLKVRAERPELLNTVARTA